jgi:hypothetical protein
MPAQQSPADRLDQVIGPLIQTVRRTGIRETARRAGVDPAVVSRLVLRTTLPRWENLISIVDSVGFEVVFRPKKGK